MTSNLDWNQTRMSTVTCLFPPNFQSTNRNPPICLDQLPKKAEKLANTFTSGLTVNSLMIQNKTAMIFKVKVNT